jgi:hypothetical protein
MLNYHNEKIVPSSRQPFVFYRAGRNELPRCKQRGIKRKISNAPSGGELNLYPPLAD